MIFVLWRSFGSTHTQRPKRLSKVIFVNEISGSPFQQINGIRVLNFSAVLDVLGQRGESGELGSGIIQATLRANLDNLSHATS